MLDALGVEPFLTLQTTRIAAVKNFRRFTGCVIDPNYVKT